MALLLLHHAFALSDYEEEDSGSAFFTVRTLSIAIIFSIFNHYIHDSHNHANAFVFTVYFAANYFLHFTLLHYCLGDQSLAPSKAKTGICLVSASVF